MRPCRLAFLIVIVATLAWLPPAHGQQPAAAQDSSLQVYAATVIKTRLFARSEANAVYLGRGALITAAHVVGRRNFLDELQIRIAGTELPATVVKEGSPEQVDLMLLAVDEAQLPVGLRLRRNPLCQGPVRTGQEVVAVGARGTARSRVLSPRIMLPQHRARYGTVIGDVALATSGTGVFEARRRCLLGIVSRQIARLDSRHPGPPEYAKYFVPAAALAAFIPAEFRF